jgi:hypothetical protein
MMTHLLIVLASWILGVAAALCALWLALKRPPHRLSLPLATLSLAIGYLGFGHWSPFRFFPQVGWMYTSGDFSIHLASSWFFVVPLVLSVVVVACFVGRNTGRTTQ